MLDMNTYIISGYMVISESYKLYNELAYIASTESEAVDTCQRHNPRFDIKSVRCDA